MLNTSWQSPHLDAIALVNAQQRQNGESVRRIIAECDLPTVARCLAQMVATGVRTQGFTLEQFLDMLTEKTIDAAEDDEAAGENDR